MPEEYINSQVIAQEKCTDILRIIKVKKPANLEFKAGQFTKIGLTVPNEERPLMRAYSFVNPPASDELEFCYDVLNENGNLTPMLDKLQENDEILVSTRPNGLLTIDNLPSGLTLVMVGSGTGIGPFLSILDEATAWEKFEKIVLVYSVRYENDMLFKSRIDNIKLLNPERFCFVPIITREKIDKALHTRITTAIDNGEFEDYMKTKIDTSCQFMLCGNPQMVQDLSDLLKTKGLERNRRSKPGNITIEKYW